MAKILLIDDEENARVLTAQFLELAGHQVVTAENGIQGHERALERAFDLVITDSIRPERKGVKRSRIARGNDPAYPSSPFQGEGSSKAMSYWKWPFPWVLPQV